MKTLPTLAALAALLMCLTACGGGNAPDNAANDNAATPDASAFPEAVATPVSLPPGSTPPPQQQQTPPAQAQTPPPAAPPVAAAPAALPEVNIDQIDYGNDLITITGWQAVDASSEYSIALVTGSGQELNYPPAFINRADVAALVHKSPADHLGFRTVLLTSAIQPASYQIGIRTGQTEGKRLVLSAKKVTIPVKPLSPVPQILPPDGNITFFFDKAESQAGFVTVSGWAFRSGAQNWTKDEPILVLLTPASGTPTYAFPTYLDRRPDVAAKYNNPQIENVGFATVFNAESLAHGQYEITLAIRSPEGWVARKTGKTITL
ncbi:MAG: hypothetical protein JO295_03075 [Verrucomicrobia bacterium]|nr:hypothetical protein [Verrucomicrobiota bacterium]